MKRTLSVLLTAALLLTALAACRDTARTTPAPEPTPEAELTWDSTRQYVLDQYGETILTDVSAREAVESGDNARVFYEIFVGSFSDSDGDGVGDLRGILNRIDYLNDGDPNSGLSLGVEGLWLTPIYPSGSYHKYDVNDYYNVDPSFGTLDDLKELIAACHERNVKLILDLPINHTGPRHEWFLAFKAAHQSGDTSDPYYDWYSWAGADDRTAGHTWQQIEGTNHYYECNFSGDMPELNFDSEAVRQAVVDVAKFYLDMGVDGFRFDAAKYLYLNDHAANLAFWTWYLDQLRSIDPDIYTVAEVWDADGITDLYYPAVNCFDFTLSQSEGLISTTAQGGAVDTYTAYVSNYLKKIGSLSARTDTMLAPFIANHDTDRAAGYLTVASGRMKVAANLYLLSPGSPFIYYGEEVGMRGSRGGANTDANRRLAMIWGDGDTVTDPEGADYTSQTTETVADQIGSGWSLLSYYKKLILIRRSNPEIARGEYTPLSFPDTRAGGFTSTWEGSTVAVLHNPTIHSVTLDLSGLSVSELVAVIGVEEATLEGTTLTLGAQTSVVLK